MNKVTQTPIIATHIKFLSYAFLFMLACFADLASADIDEWSSLGPEGTRVTTLTIDPSNPAVVYIGTGDGVYKSTDSGATWQLMNNGASASTCMSPNI
jgi:hypothetical protein